MARQERSTNQQTQKKTQKTEQKPDMKQSAQVPINQLTNMPDLRIGSSEIDQIDRDRIYPSIDEFLREVDILIYETYAGELKTKNKDDYWSAHGIDHFCADLGIGVSELAVYDLGKEWLVLAFAKSVNDNRPSCAAVTHDKSDTHALEKACRRAGRNARQYLIPLIRLRYMLEEAKKERDNEVAEDTAIKDASTKAGTVMRENRVNFEGITDVQSLLEKAAEIRGKDRDSWSVEDWEWLSVSILDTESYLLKQLSSGIESNEDEMSEEIDEDDETDEDDRIDEDDETAFDTMAGQMEESNDEEDES